MKSGVICGIGLFGLFLIWGCDDTDTSPNSAQTEPPLHPSRLRNSARHAPTTIPFETSISATSMSIPACPLMHGRTTFESDR